VNLFPLSIQARLKTIAQTPHSHVEILMMVKKPNAYGLRKNCIAHVSFMLLSFKSKSLIVFGFVVLFDPIIPRSSLIPCSDPLSLFARITSLCAPILAHSRIQFADIRGQFFVIRGFSSLSFFARGGSTGGLDRLEIQCSRPWTVVLPFAKNQWASLEYPENGRQLYTTYLSKFKRR
jgi:hypothetical protein